MTNKEKIPKLLLRERLELFSEEKTEKIVKRVSYSYHGLLWKISDEKFKRKIGIRIFPFPRLSIKPKPQLMK